MRIRIHKPCPGSERNRAPKEVVYRSISLLKLDPRNPRSHGKKQIRQIARSIETFGFNVPVLIDANSKVIAGHGRILACQLLGWSDVPTICLEHLTEAQARAFMIADNRLTENAAWDERLLAEQLHDLSLMELDFSLEVTGFEVGEIDLRIHGLESNGDGDEADKLPVVSRSAVSCAGDVWLLGSHRIYCGNALDEASYAKLMGAEKAAMVFSDPPYNVAIDGNVSGFGANRHRDFAMAFGEMGAAEYTAFLARAVELNARHSKPAAIHFYCIDWRHFLELHEAGRNVRLDLLNVCVWAKSTAAMGSLYRSQHELVFVLRKHRERHRNNVQLGRFGRDRSNVWNYPGAVGLRTSEEGNLVALHPTVKPAAMVADAIMDVSARGDIVLDNFLGSGTTVIAAQRTGRRCFGIEIDALYVDVAIRRWQEFTRDHARHAANGRTFDDIQVEVDDGSVRSKTF
jgi:DNA modification methylase